MIRPDTYILHADEGGSIWAEVTMDKTVIHDDEETYEVPTFYLELLIEKVT